MTDPEKVAEPVEIPTDFTEYEHWRNTGELPGKKEEEPPAAEGDKPEAKPAPDSDPDTKQETTEEAPPPGVQKRIDKAIAKQRDAERRAAEAERRLAEIQGSRPAIEKTAESAAAPLEEPQASAFETYDSYVRALTRFELKNELRLERAGDREVDAGRNEATGQCGTRGGGADLADEPDLAEFDAAADLVARLEHTAIEAGLALTGDRPGERAAHQVLAR